MSPPRYFAPRSTEPSTEVPLLEPENVLSVLASVRVRTTHGAPAEWLIARMLSGALVPIPNEERRLLPPRLQQVIASHEVAGGRTLEVDARSLHLFEIELLEQSPDAPGLDDPVHLYGALSGPFPPSPEAPSRVTHGQLTVTRAELLSALCVGQASAFTLPPADGTTRASRAISGVFAGDREAAILAGEGLVLGLPLLPVDLSMSDASNELVVSQLVHDVLAMLRDDARANHPAHPLAQLVLPVPSRAALETRLGLDGWSIEGDVATKKPSEEKGFAGVIASVLHPIAAERRVLPPEADVVQFLALAERVLPAIPGWPGPRARALASRVSAVPSSTLRTAATSTELAHVPAPVPQGPAATPLVGGRVPRPVVSTARDEWMRDFLDAGPARERVGRGSAGAPKKTSPSSAPARPKARLTPTRKASPEGGVPEWMRDFDVDDHDD